MCARYESLFSEKHITIMRQPQESTIQYFQDCYSPIRHDTIAKDMSLFQSQSHTISGAMLNKDNRRFPEQNSKEPRPVSEPLLAREPRFVSDRAEGCRKSNEITISRPIIWKTPSNPSFSAIQHSFSALISSSSLSTSPSSTSFSDNPPLENVLFSPLAFPSLFPQLNTCHTINPNMPIAVISHACPYSSMGKHTKLSPQYPPSPSVLATSLQTMRYASEQGKLLAQKSRTSLNKLLDSVMDNAAALTESSSRHQPQLNSIKKNCGSAKFYIDDGDDSEDEKEEESEEEEEDDNFSEYQEQPTSESIPNYHREQTEQDIFVKKDQQSHGQLNISSMHPIQPSSYLESGRRQSLLSNMLIAEKHLAAQRASITKHPNCSSIGKPRQSSYSSVLYPCLNSELQEGDSIASSINPQQIYQTFTQSSPKILTGRLHQNIQSSHEDWKTVPNQIDNSEKIPISPLRRTKTSLFKNLDGLVLNFPENQHEIKFKQPRPQHHTITSKIEPIMAIASKPGDCKTPYVILDNPNTNSPPISHRKNHTPHSTLPAPTRTCCCSPATATTKTAFATVSATSKCTNTTTSMSSAASIAAAVAATTGNEDNSLGWAQMDHIQTHLQSAYGHITSSIQKAISSASSSLQM